MGKITTVEGIERPCVWRDLSGHLDTAVELRRCPFCGFAAGFRPDPQDRNYLRAECSNTSCGIATPFHYKTREAAVVAWNRRPTAE